MRKWLIVSTHDLASLLHIFQKIVSLGAIIIGAILAYKIFIEPGESYAKADIQHERTRFVRENRILLTITMLLENTAPSGGRSDIDQAIEKVLNTARKLLIAGGGGAEHIPEINNKMVELAGGMNGKMAVIPTAAGSNAYNLDVWTEAGIGQVFHLHANDRDEANSSAFYSQLDDCTAVWFEGGSQRILEERYVRTATEEAFYRLLQRGGAIGGTSAGAAIQSKLMRRTSSGGQAIEGTGFDFLFGSYIDQHFWQRNRQPFAQQMLANNPGYLAFGIDENTALVVEGQKLTAISDPSQSGHHSVNIYLSSQTDPMNPDYVMNNGDTLDLVHLLNELKTR